MAPFNINLCTNGIHKVDSGFSSIHEKQKTHTHTLNTQQEMYIVARYAICFFIVHSNIFFVYSHPLHFHLFFVFESVKSETLIYGFMFIAKSHLFISIENITQTLNGIQKWGWKSYSDKIKMHARFMVGFYFFLCSIFTHSLTHSPSLLLSRSRSLVTINQPLHQYKWKESILKLHLLIFVSFGNKFIRILEKRTRYARVLMVSKHLNVAMLV